MILSGMQLPPDSDFGDPGGLESLRGPAFEELRNYQEQRGPTFEGLRGSFEGHVNLPEGSCDLCLQGSIYIYIDIYIYIFLPIKLDTHNLFLKKYSMKNLFLLQTYDS